MIVDARGRATMIRTRRPDPAGGTSKEEIDCVIDDRLDVARAIRRLVDQYGSTTFAIQDIDEFIEKLKRGEGVED